MSPVPDAIRYLVETLPPKGTPIHKLRKRAFLRALSAALDLYYPEEKPAGPPVLLSRLADEGDPAGGGTLSTTDNSLPR